MDHGGGRDWRLVKCKITRCTIRTEMFMFIRSVHPSGALQLLHSGENQLDQKGNVFSMNAE